MSINIHALNVNKNTLTLIVKEPDVEYADCGR